MDNNLVVDTLDLTKRYGRRLAVDRLNLRIRRGEVYGFVGPNGAGKTTTLRMLVGLIAPTSGSAVVLGRAPGSPAGLSRVGALIETPTFYPYLSGRDNLTTVAHYAGVGTWRVDAVLAQVALTDRADDRFQTYSLGMKQRLGVAAALLKDPTLLILDEPTNGLDPAGMADMRELIRQLHLAGRTVLFSSHQLADVAELSDRVGVIAGGRLVAEGTVAALTGGESVWVRAHPRDLVQRVTATLVGEERVQATDDGFGIDVDAGQIPALTQVLVENDAVVSEIRPVTHSLADVFFALTGERPEAAGPDDGRER